MVCKVSYGPLGGFVGRFGGGMALALSRGMQETKTAAETNHFDFTEDRWGNVTLECGDDTVFMQGDDAAAFLAEVQTIDEIWSTKGNPNPAIFEQYADHLDLLIDPYFAA